MTGHSALPAASAEAKGRRVWLALGALLLVAYALFLGATWYPVIVGADDHGYYAQGAHLVNDGRMWFDLESPVQYVGRHWLRDVSARYVSRYSPGMGMLVAGVTWFASPEASLALNPLLALLSLLGLWTLVATRLGRGWGVAAMATLALSPAFTGQAMLGGSHVVVTCLLVWGTHLLLRWRERGGALRAVGAGMLMGFVPVIRPSEAVLALGVGALLLLTAFDGTRPWRHVWLAAAGALLAASPLLIYNHQTFGHFARTAYAITKEQTAFSLSYLPQNVTFYARYLLRHGLGVFTVLSVAGIVYIVAARQPDEAGDTREARIRGALLALLTGSVVALYLNFFYVPQKQPALAVRFLVPVFPLLIFASLALVRRGASRLAGTARWAVLGALFAVHAAWGISGIDRMTRQLVAQKRRAAALAEAVKELVPPGSVVFSTEEALLINLDVLGRWHVADRLLSLDDPLNAILDGKVSSAGLAKQRGKRQLQMARFEGLSAQGRDSSFAEEAHRWGGGRAVYYVGPRATIERPTSELFSRERFDIVAERPLPPLQNEVARPDAWGTSGETFVVARWNVGGAE